MEVPPTSFVVQTPTIPTLWTVEQSWLGQPPPTPPHDLLKSEKGVFSFRTITSTRIIRLIEHLIVTPYAMCNRGEVPSSSRLCESSEHYHVY